MENKYCVPGLAYYCPYVQRCEEEGKSAVILIRRPLMPFNSKIKKHFNWNSREGERITCLLRRVICKDLSDLLEEDEFEFGEEFEAFFTKRKIIEIEFIISNL